MLFIYGTDFHGEEKKFEAILNTALEQRIDLIHLGADILPKGPNLIQRQKKFIKGYLREFYTRCKKEHITVLASFGNDDIPLHRPLFHRYAKSLDHHPYIRNPYKFISYNQVPDYPFALKCACKMDYPGWILKEEYISAPIEVDENGFYVIKDPQGYFKNKGSIEEDLQNIPADSKTIAAIHCPPQSLEMDLCKDGCRVGSKAVTDWILHTQPLLVLCGHIHEAPEHNGGIWKSELGNTLVIQPGQEQYRTTMVIIEIGERIRTQRLSMLE